MPEHLLRLECGHKAVCRSLPRGVCGLRRAPTAETEDLLSPQGPPRANRLPVSRRAVAQSGLKPGRTECPFQVAGDRSNARSAGERGTDASIAQDLADMSRHADWRRDTDARAQLNGDRNQRTKRIQPGCRVEVEPGPRLPRTFVRGCRLAT